MKNIAIGSRLKEERERLGFTQAGFAELAEASKRSQIGWEKGDRYPDAGALSAWAENGVDVLFVLTGARAEDASGDLPPDEQLLLEAYRGLGPAKRKLLLAELLSGGVAPRGAAGSGFTISGGNNRIAGRDHVTHNAPTKKRK